MIIENFVLYSTTLQILDGQLLKKYRKSAPLFLHFLMIIAQNRFSIRLDAFLVLSQMLGLLQNPFLLQSSFYAGSILLYDADI
mgnify:CR=1 FL=1